MSEAGIKLKSNGCQFPPEEIKEKGKRGRRGKQFNDVSFLIRNHVIGTGITKFSFFLFDVIETS